MLTHLPRPGLGAWLLLGHRTNAYKLRTTPSCSGTARSGKLLILKGGNWSGRRDLNPGPPEPHSESRV